MQTLKIQNEVRLKQALEDKTEALVKKQTSAKKPHATTEKSNHPIVVKECKVQDQNLQQKSEGSVAVKRKPSLGTETLTDGSCNDKQDAEVATPTVRKMKKHSTGGIDKENKSPKVLANKSQQQKHKVSAQKVPQKPTMCTECDNSEHFGLVEEIKFLEEKCERSDKKMIDQETLIKELTTLNVQLQREVIQYFDEFKAMAKQYEGGVRNLEGADTPPPGFNRATDHTIHLGRTVWIPKSKYNYIVRVAKSKQLFVKEMAVAVFGLEVLQNSSVTGTKCNRFKDREAKPALDDVKILAIQDIFRHWLINTKKLAECQAELESSKAQTYITRKISDLMRSVTKKSSAATESTQETVSKLGENEGKRNSFSANDENTMNERNTENDAAELSGGEGMEDEQTVEDVEREDKNELSGQGGDEVEPSETDDGEEPLEHNDEQELGEGAEETEGEP